MALLTSIPDYYFPVKFTHSGYDVKIEKSPGGSSAYMATYKPADPLYGEKCYLVGMLSDNDFRDYVDVASAYVASLALPSAVTETVGSQLLSLSGMFNSAKTRLDRMIRNVRRHVDSDLPAIAKFDFNDYISFLESHGLRNEILKSIKYVNKKYTL